MDHCALKSGLCFVIALLLGCSGNAGVGDPCIPEDEYVRTFSGFGINEVHVESSSLQCATRLCLVNHFQGRVSCPQGQTSEDLLRPVSDPARCRVPDGSDVGAIDVPVAGWDLDRPAERAVYCSCRCDGPDKTARYCKCPDGYTCTDLAPDLGFGATELPGSYCVRTGTEFEDRDVGGPTCETDPEEPICSE